MGRHLVLALGISAWLGALIAVFGHWSYERPPTPAGPPHATAERARWVTGRVAGHLAITELVGILVLGLGGRTMMRIMAATSPARVQGALTEAEEAVGEVTLEGTIGFIVFIGLFSGVLGGALLAIVREWLPRRSVLAGLLVGLLGTGTFARAAGLLDPDNLDFEILAPRWLAVALCLALPLSAGLAATVLSDRFVALWPTPSLSVRGVLSVLPLVPALALPPVAVVILTTIAVRTYSASAVATLAPRIQGAIRTLVGVAVGVSGLVGLAGAGQILVG